MRLRQASMKLRKWPLPGPSLASALGMGAALSLSLGKNLLSSTILPPSNTKSLLTREVRLSSLPWASLPPTRPHTSNTIIVSP